MLNRGRRLPPTKRLWLRFSRNFFYSPQTPRDPGIWREYFAGRQFF